MWPPAELETGSRRDRVEANAAASDGGAKLCVVWIRGPKPRVADLRDDPLGGRIDAAKGWDACAHRDRFAEVLLERRERAGIRDTITVPVGGFPASVDGTGIQGVLVGLRTADEQPDNGDHGEPSRHGPHKESVVRETSEPQPRARRRPRAPVAVTVS